jgi:hypothetical protein
LFGYAPRLTFEKLRVAEALEGSPQGVQATEGVGGTHVGSATKANGETHVGRAIQANGERPEGDVTKAGRKKMAHTSGARATQTIPLERLTEGAWEKAS